MERLRDSHGRGFTDLRVSLTDRCNFRCVYCHNEGLGEVRSPRAPAPGEITAAEAVRLVRIAREFGLERVKFTGGEPLLRADLEEILRALPREVESSLTTNGSLLAERAAGLRSAGLSRVNVSVDSLDASHFRRVRRGDLGPVLRGVEAALEAGLAPVKINMVVLDDTVAELPRLLEWVAARPGLDLQLIEVMPEIRTDLAERRADVDAVRAALASRADRVEVRAMHHRRVYHLGGARVELVDPVGNPEFCANCHRIRVTHRAELKGCLNVLDGLVPTRGLDDDGVRAAFRRVVRERRPFYTEASVVPSAAAARPSPPTG